MRRLFFACATLLVLVLMASCHDSETYADQKKKERAAINNYVNSEGIKVLSESEFEAKGYRTDTTRNEFVLFEGSGVYMQIIREGCGEKIQTGETVNVICRFTEVNLLTDSIQLTNNVFSFSDWPEKMTVQNSSGTFTGTFDTSSSLMYTIYSSATVPTGWLVPFTYIKVGRQQAEGDELAKVKLIVPHSQGQTYATQNVYPCLYTITYQRGR